MFVVESYEDERGRDHFQEWRKSLRDLRARLAVDRRIMRVIDGNFGDHKSVGKGVWELRIDYGPGLRIYYAHIEDRIVLLLAGGDKSSQSEDIAKAQKLLHAYEGGK